MLDFGSFLVYCTVPYSCFYFFKGGRMKQTCIDFLLMPEHAVHESSMEPNEG